MSLSYEGSLQGLREAVFLRTDTGPNPSYNIVLAANHFVNMAVQQVAMECPYAFHESAIRMATQAEVSSYDTTDTITLVSVDPETPGSIANRYVFKRDVSEAIAGAVDPSYQWPIDRQLDGAYIQITDGDNVIHTNQIRSVWITDPLTTSNYAYISLVNPFYPRRPEATAEGTSDYGPFTYRIFHPFLWLPDDVVQLKSMRIMGESAPSALEVLSQEAAEEIGINDYNYTSSSDGLPRWAYRRGHFQLQPPATAPVVAASATLPWRGPEPFGSFKYVYTYCIGKRDWDYDAGGRANQFDGDDFSQVQSFTETNTFTDFYRQRHREPLFESAPSPESESITLADPGSGTAATAIEVQVPHINYQMGWWWQGKTTSPAPDTDIASVGDGQSGVYIRIYRKRLSTTIGDGYTSLGNTVAGTRVTALNMLDLHDSYYLLGEFRADGNEAVFGDRGEIVPDHSRRLRNVHGYQALRLHPTPNARYEIEARVLRRPQLLVSDTDVPNVQPIAIKAIVDLATSYMLERMKDPIGANRNLAMYKEAIQVITRRYADMRPASSPTRRRPARLWRPLPSTRWWGSGENS